MFSGRKLSDDAIIIEKDKTDFGVTDGLEVKLVFDVTGLGIFGSKKFSPSGEVIEERSDFNLGSLFRPADFFGISLLPDQCRLLIR